LKPKLTLAKNGENIQNVKRNATNESLGKITECHRKYFKTWEAQIRHVEGENKVVYKIKLKIL
jgi:hypothetical protein